MEQHPPLLLVADVPSLTRSGGTEFATNILMRKHHDPLLLMMHTTKITAVIVGPVLRHRIQKQGTEGNPHDLRAVIRKASERHYHPREGRLTASFMRKIGQGDCDLRRQCRMTVGESTYSHVHHHLYKDALCPARRILKISVLSKLVR